MKNSLFPILALLVAGLSQTAMAAPDDRPNVLFIAVDDLRPQLNSYGRSQMHTPNIDELATSGVLFERAYAMVPSCGASRASLMTGILPAPGRFNSYDSWAERDAPGIPTMNDHFKANGYHTASFGKVFHHSEDHAEGWTGPNWTASNSRGYVTEENRNPPAGSSRGYPYEKADQPESNYPDYEVASRAMKHLNRASDRDRPWFIAVGFYKPHLPFAAPARYWDLYDEQDIHLPPNYEPPKNAPDEALHTWGELRNYRGVPESGPITDRKARRLIHGYYACTSFTDAQVGRVLDRLEQTGEADNTIVVLWGDHGWQLGEHALWCKHSTFETSMQIPLIVRAPGIEGNRRTRGLTESIDLYPTLCDMAGIGQPDHLDGTSFLPLLRDPDRTWQDAAVGRHYNGGETIRTRRYRYSEHRGDRWETDEVTARMLYDHQVDPGETVNIAPRDDVQAVVDRLSRELRSKRGKADRFNMQYPGESNFGTNTGKSPPGKAGFITTVGSHLNEADVADAWQIAAPDDGGEAGFSNVTFLQTFDDVGDGSTTDFKFTMEANVADAGPLNKNNYRFGIQALAGDFEGNDGVSAVLRLRKGEGVRMDLTNGVNGSELVDPEYLRGEGFAGGDEFTLELRGKYVNRSQLDLTYTATDGTNTKSLTTTVDPAQFNGRFFGGVARLRDGFTVHFDEFAAGAD